MASGETNLYQDRLESRSPGFGADISSQRADDLDLAACAYLMDAKAAGQSVLALDVGCGIGGQAFRMARAGAGRVIGLDIAAIPAEFYREAADRAGAVLSDVLFCRQDMTALPFVGEMDLAGQVGVLVCQRAIHYLPHKRARMLLEAFFTTLEPGGRLYLSASGMASELVSGYEDAGLDVAARFCRLGLGMRQKHKIESPVCLYWREELAWIVESAGIRVLGLTNSPFGNVKLIGEKPA